MSGARQRDLRNRDAFTSNLPCRRCSAIAAILALVMLLLCGPALVWPAGAFFQQAAPVLAQAQ